MSASGADFDAVVVGGGLAGMLAALELGPRRVALVSARALGELTASAWAQGGIAAAVGDDDSPALHEADTVAAGAGLVERRVAARLVADGPAAIERIVALGVRFDREDALHFALGREGAHSRRRILRAGGDATGAELVRAVAAAVVRRSHVMVFAGARARALLQASDGRIAGAFVRHDDGSTLTLHAPTVVLATGGLGGLYRYTTNPSSSRGSGIALAARAGARLADLEFVQFHPTALAVADDPLPLVSEAVRGEGATLVDERGVRIMEGIDSRGELAPRDLVARRIFELSEAGSRVFLDARNSLGERFPQRFPTVFAAALAHGIDPRRELLPVVAAAHYHMGGIAVDLAGRTSVPGLYACGEVAATGVHGANRLASNSLLESVVYPERIARDVVERYAAGEASPPPSGAAFEAALNADGPSATERAADAEATHRAWGELRTRMYAQVGIVRDEARLAQACASFERLVAEAADPDLRDGALVAALVARAALRRRETRGSHIRRDFPASAPRAHHSSLHLRDLHLERPA
ncbi:MAG: L-aspartate oxidase [Vulcanimicrobiaceae bacterium]